MYWTDDDFNDDLLGSNAASAVKSETYTVMFAHVDEKPVYIAWLGEAEIGVFSDIDTAKIACEQHETSLTEAA